MNNREMLKQIINELNEFKSDMLYSTAEAIEFTDELQDIINSIENHLVISELQSGD